VVQSKHTLRSFYMGGVMLFLNAAEVELALPMDELIQSMKGAFSALSAGLAHVPLRTQIPVEEHKAVSLFMPAYVNTPELKALTLKAVSVFPDNPGLGLPTIHAAVLVVDQETGQVQALLEGGRLTALRTGAASGAATDVLSRKDSEVGAIFGAGTQARTQLRAICTARDLDMVWIYDPDREQAEKLIQEMKGKHPIPEDLQAAHSARQAVGEADVICTATTSTTPVFSDQDLKPGVHINGIGSYTPEMVEVPPETAGRALVVVGSREGVLAEAGEILQAIERGLLARGDLLELGDILNQEHKGRTAPDQITLFKSVGVAVQDAAAAHLALRNAREKGLGRKLSW